MAVVELRSRVMASELHLIVVDPLPGQIDDAVELLAHLEATWSRFVPTSDVCRVNRLAGTAVAVDDATLTLVATMLEAWRLTAGRYDPTVLPALEANGYDRSTADPDRRSGLHGAADPVGDPAAIVVDAAGATIVVPSGTAIDPGGLGKGLAADLAVAQLLAGGALGALVAIGGDLSMAGQPPHPDGWLVTVEHADHRDALCTLAVSGGGVATSSTRSRRWTHQGRERHHLIDPATGHQATTDLAAVTVLASTGWAAEAHATAALLAGSAHAIDHLVGHGLSGLAITEAGAVLATADIGALGVGPGPFDLVPAGGAR